MSGPSVPTRLSSPLVPRIALVDSQNFAAFAASTSLAGIVPVSTGIDVGGTTDVVPKLGVVVEVVVEVEVTLVEGVLVVDEEDVSVGQSAVVVDAVAVRVVPFGDLRVHT